MSLTYVHTLINFTVGRVTPFRCLILKNLRKNHLIVSIFCGSNYYNKMCIFN